jgi:hypothetical protein
MDTAVTYIQPQGQFAPLVTQQPGGPQNVFPMPAATISTPTVVPSDTHLPVFLSEIRNQNLEVRMGVAKAVDKVDQVLMKVISNHLVQEDVTELLLAVLCCAVLRCAALS